MPHENAAGAVGLMTSLKRDPSLRFTELGRVLIRLLDCSSMDVKQLDDLVRSVPPHQRATVVRLAHERAGVWRTFADRLGRESDTEMRSA